MNNRIYLLALGITLFAGAAMADDAVMALAKKNNCLTCHGIDNKIVGPGWKDVARKYAGDAAAESQLASKIKSGGKDVWGPIPMPPNPALTDADTRELARFVLSLK